MTDLPDGWLWVDLAEVADVQGGIQKQAKRQPVENKFPFLRVANVYRGWLDLSEVHEVELFDGELERFRLFDGDLLVVEGNGSPEQIGRAARWDGRIKDCVHQNHLIRVRPTTALDPRYLELIWNSPLVARHLQKIAGSTSGLYTLSSNKLKSVRIALPPLGEQRRIAVALQELLQRVDAGRVTLSTCSARAALLPSAFAEELLAPHRGDCRPVSSVLTEEMINGRSVPTRAGGFPVLRLTAVKDGLIDLSERKSGAWGDKEARPFLVKKGDFLVSRGNGSIRLVGRGGLVASNPDPIAFPDTLIRLRPDLTQIRADYLALVWNSPVVRTQIESAARTTAGIYKINQKILQKLMIPVPSLSEQDKILAAWEDASVGLGALGASLSALGSRADRLRLAVLSQAFAGRLASQDPNDEPASELLERIRAERAARIPKQRTRSRRTSKDLPAPPTRVTGGDYEQEALPL